MAERDVQPASSGPSHTGGPEKLDTLKDTLRGYLKVFSALEEETFIESMGRVVRLLAQTREKGGTIFIAGNGGSASTASHWVNDLCKATKSLDRRSIRAMSLSDNVSWLTALANDEGYERAFSGQLENLAQAGDVLVVISASGNSPNLLAAVEVATARGVSTVGMLGFDGGDLRTVVDECLWVRTEKGAYGVVESVHSTLCHVVTTALAGERDPLPTS